MLAFEELPGLFSKPTVLFSFFKVISFFKKNLFIFGCTRSLLAAHRLSQLPCVGTALQLQCPGFLPQWLLLLQKMGSRVFRPQQLWHMGLVALWHVGSSQTSNQTVSPALVGRFLTIRPLRKPLIVVLICIFLMSSDVEQFSMCLLPTYISNWRLLSY